MTKQFELYLGDCLETLKSLPDCSVDSIVTDPPYGLSFMGKKWDYDVPGEAIWAECLRVLKPGGHLLAFAGTRTQHRMAVRIEDAGFEIRDMIAWVYGSGFPKSLDVSKALEAYAKTGRSDSQVTGDGRSRAPGQHFKEFRRGNAPKAEFNPETEAARQWQGWGTALKPALEPITVARKPLVGTVAANVLEHGAGALNIDGCRVHSNDSQGYAYTVQRMMPGAGQNATGKTHQEGVEFSGHTKDGRWPANLIHDGSDEVLEAFPQAPGQLARASSSSSSRKTQNTYGAMARGSGGVEPRDDTGSAARFFYCAKASRADRNEGLPSGDTPAVGTGATMREREIADWPTRNGNHHPTVKPTDLMAYLCRLVTPPGGVVLDPFMGSGSTGKAAMREGFRFIGCELSAEYLSIAQARIEHARQQAEAAASVPEQLDLLAAE